MVETLKTRVSRVIAGGVHHLLNKIEDMAPLAMLEQSVRDVETVLDEVRTELGRVTANRHLVQQQHWHLNQEHDQLSQSITMAISSHREDLAKSAIARQLDIEAQLPILETSLLDLTQQERELSSFVDGLLGKKREMQQAIKQYEQICLQDMSQPTKANSQVNSKLEKAQENFDRVYQRHTGLDSMASSKSVQNAAKLSELNDLVRENKINERLKQMILTNTQENKSL